MKKETISSDGWRAVSPRRHICMRNEFRVKGWRVRREDKGHCSMTLRVQRLWHPGTLLQPSPPHSPPSPSWSYSLHTAPSSWAAGPPQRVLDAPSALVWSRPLPRQVQLRPLPLTPSSQQLAPVSTLQHLIWETTEFLSHLCANGWIFQDLLQSSN